MNLKTIVFPSDKMKGISHWLHSSLIKIQSALKANDELKLHT